MPKIKVEIVKPIGGLGYFKGDTAEIEQKEADKYLKKGMVKAVMEGAKTTVTVKKEAAKGKK
ncbi:hypothetical protein DN752_19610 [Echinicola strongylocentroti]|uniref:Uncharacterized protein n=1 Tax=Echinicola strongylocentroti TaxID=1795355 RepID=A0A2Z4IN56_9BACT|nr:hypothetical protein [Echinicola strongylocentroti]AWW32169.1 hypothetical protein DN752_19610 [Echinicola strongylocentroti]